MHILSFSFICSLVINDEWRAMLQNPEVEREEVLIDGSPCKLPVWRWISKIKMSVISNNVIFLQTLSIKAIVIHLYICLDRVFHIIEMFVYRLVLT